MTSELFLIGYPPQDLLFRNDFIKKVEFFKKKIFSMTKKQRTIFLLNIPQEETKKIFNVLFLIKNGKVVFKKNKSILPNYGVFDEKRYFYSKGIDTSFYLHKSKKIKFLICEEMWSEKFLKKNNDNYDFTVSINASPFEIEKFSQRIKKSRNAAKAFDSDLIYLNHVGCQDELIFDGGSFLMNKGGEIITQAKFFQEDEIIIDTKSHSSNKVVTPKNKMENLYQALMYSLKTYMKNNKFREVVLGLSGGIDSALCSLIAADTLGSKNVKPVFMPTIYTSNESKRDVKSLCKNLGLKFDNILIDDLRKKILSKLDFIFKDLAKNLAEENIQSRIRGLILMAISNKFNSLLIATGNKSELAVGYSTLYGDMCGGFSLIKDLYKSQVFSLVKWRNDNIPMNAYLIKKKLIPENIIIKEPTAELRFNQKDKDSLPEYEKLDKVLELLIDKNYGIKQIKKFGYSENMIKMIWEMIKKSEFKRYQSTIGPKISSMSFDKDRRFPITNNFSI